MKQDKEKLLKLGDEVGMLICGDLGDCISFGEFIQKNIQLYRIRHGYAMSPHAAANWTRSELAYYLRRSPFMVNSVIGGYDTDKKEAKLYFMDYLASLVEVPYAAHGYSAYFILSIFDRFYREDMSKEEAVKLLVRCLSELQTRFLINFPGFSYYFVDENGFSEKETIAPEAVKAQMESLKTVGTEMET
jgi:20S proteasome subunit beta 4